MNIGRCNCGGGFEKILTYYCNLGGLVFIFVVRIVVCLF